MATCKDCIHNLVCVIYAPKQIDILANGEYCSEYKNKADVVEVVRCKDCIHHMTYINAGGHILYRCKGGVGLDDPHYDGFCSCGERKE